MRILVLLAALAVFAMGTPGGKKMDSKTLHDRISKADKSVLNNIGSVPDGNYSNLSDLTRSKHPEVRHTLVRFCLHFKKDWSREILFSLLKDSDASVRALSASGIMEQARKEDSRRILQEIEYQITAFKEDDRNIADLSLALGNAGDPQSLEPLLAFRIKEKDPETGESMDMALAKLGFEKETRKLEMTLGHGSARDIEKALATIQYIGKPAWTEKIIPLLLDDRVAKTLSLGPATFKMRVCDLVINSLIKLDPKKRVPFSYEDFDGPYDKKDLESVRKAYGLI